MSPQVEGKFGGMYWKCSVVEMGDPIVKIRWEYNNEDDTILVSQLREVTPPLAVESVWHPEAGAVAEAKFGPEFKECTILEVNDVVIKVRWSDDGTEDDVISSKVREKAADDVPPSHWWMRSAWSEEEEEEVWMPTAGAVAEAKFGPEFKECTILEVNDVVIKVRWSDDGTEDDVVSSKVREKAFAEMRVDPETGQASTLADMKETYGGQYSSGNIQAYWETCALAPAQQQRAEAEPQWEMECAADWSREEVEPSIVGHVEAMAVDVPVRGTLVASSMAPCAILTSTGRRTSVYKVWVADNGVVGEFAAWAERSDQCAAEFRQKKAVVGSKIQLSPCTATGVGFEFEVSGKPTVILMGEGSDQLPVMSLEEAVGELEARVLLSCLLLFMYFHPDPSCLSRDQPMCSPFYVSGRSPKVFLAR